MRGAAPFKIGDLGCRIWDLRICRRSVCTHTAWLAGGSTIIIRLRAVGRAKLSRLGGDLKFSPTRKRGEQPRWYVSAENAAEWRCGLAPTHAYQSRRRPPEGRAACGAVRRIGQTAKRVCPAGVRAREARPNQPRPLPPIIAYLPHLAVKNHPNTRAPPKRRRFHS